MPELLANLLTVEALIALLTLTSLEIVLGIDNIVFIAILTSRLEPGKQDGARRLGLAAAMITRILLLLAISWIMQLTRPLFEVLGHAISGRDLILLVGGLFLIAKATHEIHHRLDGEADSHDAAADGKRAGFWATIVQIMILDIVFSLDSVITAVGMARQVAIMIAAVVIAVGIMMAFAGSVSRFIERNPTMKMLALSFLLLVGVVLVAEGLGKEIEKGYIYFAMAFSLMVEVLNLRAARKRRRTTLATAAAAAGPGPAAAAGPGPAAAANPGAAAADPPAASAATAPAAAAAKPTAASTDATGAMDGR